MKVATMHADDETGITEISFLADGRVCVFGASRSMLEILDGLELGDLRLRRRVARLESLARALGPPVRAVGDLNDRGIHE